MPDVNGGNTHLRSLSLRLPILMQGLLIPSTVLSTKGFSSPYVCAQDLIFPLNPVVALTMEDVLKVSIFALCKLASHQMLINVSFPSSDFFALCVVIQDYLHSLSLFYRKGILLRCVLVLLVYPRQRVALSALPFPFLQLSHHFTLFPFSTLTRGFGQIRLPFQTSSVLKAFRKV